MLWLVQEVIRNVMKSWRLHRFDELKIYHQTFHLSHHHILVYAFACLGTSFWFSSLASIFRHIYVVSRLHLGRFALHVLWVWILSVFCWNVGYIWQCYYHLPLCYNSSLAFRHYYSNISVYCLYIYIPYSVFCELWHNFLQYIVCNFFQMYHIILEKLWKFMETKWCVLIRHFWTAMFLVYVYSGCILHYLQI